jgi:DNA-binding XRE family transcriptional regulator
VTNFSERLLRGARYAGVGETQSEIAANLGVSRQTVNHWFRKGAPESENLALIEKRWGIDREWLRTGEGDMLTKPSPDGLSADERDLVKHYRSAPADRRPMILSVARAARKVVVTFAAVIPPLLASQDVDAGVLHKQNCEPNASVIRIALRRLREWLRGANPLVLSRAGFGL